MALIQAPTTYDVMTDGTGRWAAGLRLGVVTLKADGWRFYPQFQRHPSRRGWRTPDAALSGRVDHYTLVAREVAQGAK